MHLLYILYTMYTFKLYEIAYIQNLKNRILQNTQYEHYKAHCLLKRQR